jgi:hypothetical protein
MDSDDLPPIQLSDEGIRLYERYTGTKVEKREDLASFLDEIRTKAVAHLPYRCIKEGKFVNARVTSHQFYKNLVDGGLASKKIMDIGCAFGTDLRQMLVDGAKVENIIGVDQSEYLWRLGKEMFRDNGTDLDKLSDKIFIQADVLEDNFVFQFAPECK